MRSTAVHVLAGCLLVLGARVARADDPKSETASPPQPAGGSAAGKKSGNALPQPPAVPPSPRPTDRPQSELDKSLLKELTEGLDDALFEGLDDLPADAASHGDESKRGGAFGPVGPDDLDRELLRGLTEDAEPVADENPLARVSRSMRQVETLIGETRSGRPTQDLQQQIVADLDELIRELNRRSQSQSSSSSSRRQQGSQRSSAQPAGKPSASGRAGANSQQPARDSDPGQRRPQPPMSAEELAEQLRGTEIWGNLPERVREEMLQLSPEQFLPKYELLIEQYFKSLAKRRSAGP